MVNWFEMETVLEETVSSEDLKRFEQKYHTELQEGKVSTFYFHNINLVKLPLIWIYFLLSYKVSSGSQFEYAWCLVRSRYPADIRKGIILLEDLLKNREETNKRDYLYYLSIGNTRLKEYATALRFIRALLQIEPGNRQAQVDHNLTLTYRPTHFIMIAAMRTRISYLNTLPNRN